MRKTLFIVKTLEELSILETRLQAAQNAVLVGPAECKTTIKNKEIAARGFEDYVTQREDYRLKGCAARKMYEACERWGSASIEGTTLQEYLRYEELDLWTLLLSNLSNFFSAYQHRNLWDFEVLQAIIKKENPHKIVYVENQDSFSRAIGLLTASADITGESVPSNQKEPIFKKIRTQFEPAFVHYYRRGLRWKKRACAVRQAESKQNGTVLAIVTLKTGMGPLVPVLTAWNKNGGDVVTLNFDESIFTGKNTGAVFQKTGLAYNDAEAYIDSKTRTTYRKMLRFYQNRVKRLLTDTEFQKQLTYDGLPVWEMVREGFEYYFGARARYEEVLEKVSIAQQIIETENPALVVSPDAGSEVVRSLYEAAQKKKIPVLVTEHGVRFFPNTTNMKKHPFVTAFAVWGTDGKQYWERQGLPAARVCITGNPKLDALQVYQNKKKDRTEILKELAIEPEQKIVALTTTSFKHRSEIIAERTIQAMKQFPDYTLVIKKHPRDPVPTAWYTDRAKQAEISMRVSEGDLYEVFYVADAMIDCWYSTAVSEAFTFGLPVLLFTEKGEQNPALHWIEQGAVLPVYDANRLEETLRKALQDRGTRTRLQENMKALSLEYFYKLDGRATQRTIELMKKLIKQSKPQGAV